MSSGRCVKRLFVSSFAGLSVLWWSGWVLQGAQPTVTELLGPFTPPQPPEKSAVYRDAADEMDAVLAGRAPLARGEALLKEGNKELLLRVVAGREIDSGSLHRRNPIAVALLLAVDHPGARAVAHEELINGKELTDIVGLLRTLSGLPTGFIDELLSDPDPRVRAKGAWLLRGLPGSAERLESLLKAAPMGAESDNYAAALLHTPGVTVEQARTAVSHIEHLEGGHGVRPEGDYTDWNLVLGAASQYARVCPDEELARRAALTTFLIGPSSGSPFVFDRWVAKRDSWAVPHLMRLVDHASEPFTKESAWLRLAYLQRTSLLDEIVSRGEENGPTNWLRVVALAAEGTADKRALSYLRARLTNNHDPASLEYRRDLMTIDAMVKVCGSRAAAELGPLFHRLDAMQLTLVRWYEQGWTAERAMKRTREIGPSGLAPAKYQLHDEGVWPLLETERDRFIGSLVRERFFLSMNFGAREVIGRDTLDDLTEMSGGDLRVGWCRTFTVFGWASPSDVFEFEANGGVFRVTSNTRTSYADQRAVLRAVNLALAKGGVAKRFMLFTSPGLIGCVYGEPHRVSDWAKEMGLTVELLDAAQQRRAAMPGPASPRSR